MSEILYEKHKLLSFDKSYSTEVYIKNPDKSITLFVITCLWLVLPFCSMLIIW